MQAKWVSKTEAIKFLKFVSYCNDQFNLCTLIPPRFSHSSKLFLELFFEKVSVCLGYLELPSPGLEFAVILLLLPNYRHMPPHSIQELAFLFRDKVTLEYLKPFVQEELAPWRVLKTTKCKTKTEAVQKINER